MANKFDLQNWLIEALKEYGGRATIVEVCKYIWQHYEDELRNSNDLFYTWQYDIRWAATELRRQGIMCDAKSCPQGLWILC
ncbi:hypothetical protein IT084_01715 [Desulfallas sp. Bu1-1]|uniref:hypothetical protein n=1 Tax=Desulfallas sp. Bu1-1 TaxID=2787620 RepID=UPI00189E61B7|nr:hypothetical protein [Desulfallas sp. Bu1-1]MBF7081700.1 hypothetical protein [Desulfallas sp. Bu1-1]